MARGGRKKPQEGFQKAGSDNLPQVDSYAVAYFFVSAHFLRPEFKHVKLEKSARESYSNNAVGYVQLKREGETCLIWAEVTPEHKVSSGGYRVHAVVDETNGIILEARCTSCAAALAGCKHAVAFVTWLHRKSEERPVTSVECYWAKSVLSTVGTTKKFIKAAEIKKTKKKKKSEEGSEEEEEKEVQISEEKQKKFFESSLALMKQNSGESLIVQQTYQKTSYSLHHLMMDFVEEPNLNHEDPECFIKFCKQKMDEGVCKELAEKTSGQCHDSLWYDLKYARISASRIYEAANCQTDGGSLFLSTFGARKIKDTPGMKRGRDLEGSVLNVVRSKLRINFTRTGTVMTKRAPILGSSPDAISEEFIFEVKCPTTWESFDTYFTKDCREPAPKYKAQMMSQMYSCCKRHGYYCVAHPDFESTNDVLIMKVDYNRDWFGPLFLSARQYWCRDIFPTLLKSVRFPLQV